MVSQKGDHPVLGFLSLGIGESRIAVAEHGDL
jgi:hypothetical protein